MVDIFFLEEGGMRAFWKRWAAALLLVSFAVAAAAATRLVSGSSEEEWPALKERLARVDLEGSPYTYAKRTRNYDFEVAFRTPFAQAAAFVQRNAKNPEAVTLERCLSFLSSGVVSVEVSAMARGKEQAEAVKAVLRVDGKDLAPLSVQEHATRLRQIGFYAEPYYQASHTFFFDADALSGASSVLVVLIDAEGHEVEIRVKTERLE